MNVSSIITKARRDCSVESTDYDDTDALTDLNLVYEDLISRIVDEVDEDYFWDSAIDTFKTEQSEYPIEETADWTKIIEINKIFVKYSTTWDFVKARRLNPAWLEKHPSWYAENWSNADPFYYVQDRSVFVYPYPSEDITEWIEIYTINKPADLTIVSKEDDIKIPVRFHRILAIWLKQHIYAILWKLNEKNDAINEYITYADKMIAQLRDRDQWELEENISNLSYLE